MKVKRKYSIVSGCLVVVLGCACGLSACGEPSASYMPSNGGFESTNASDSASSSSISNDSSSKNSSENVSLKEVAKKCNFKPLKSDENDYLFDAVLIDGDQDASGEKFKKDYACAIKNVNPGDPVAEKFSDKLESSDINSISVNFENYDKYMPPYLGNTYYVYPTYEGIKIVKLK
ncbi:hypothetical protein [Gardnerella vaginalis]|uniref:hypothetical protein n=1 Tax=Gardnerella vaginalis TaxID=2702 RepID=UPI0039F10483